MQKKVESQNAEIDVLKAQLADLKASLAESKAEAKALTVKLAASRTAAVNIESTSVKAQESARSNATVRMVGSAEAIQEARAAQLREALFSDLTGLLVRGVKRGDESDMFDCIQTGRNGSQYPLALGHPFRHVLIPIFSQRSTSNSP